MGLNVAETFNCFAVGFTESWSFQAIIVSDLGQKSEGNYVSNVPFLSGNEVVAGSGESVIQLCEKPREFADSLINRGLVKFISKEFHVKVTFPEIILGLDDPVSPVPLSGVSWVGSGGCAEVMKNCIGLVKLDSCFINKDWDSTSWEQAFF